MLRGNGGQEVFFTDDDRYHLFLLLQEGTTRFGYRVQVIFAWVIISTWPYKLAMSRCRRSLQNLAFRYTRWINKQQQKTGHLFQDRYKAILVDAVWCKYTNETYDIVIQ